MADLTDEELLDALGVELEPQRAASRSPREERIIAGFEEIQRFFEQHGRRPLHGEERDIFERLYAVRLDRLRELPDCRELLAPMDHQGLLGAETANASSDAEELDDDALLSELGVDVPDETDVTTLRHVRPRAEIQAAEEIANRTACKDFEKFRPIFVQVQKELDAGVRSSRPFELKAEIEPGSLFIVGGQKAYVADMGEVFSNAQGRRDARLRVIFDNGTESNMLLRSMQRALHKDGAGRRITNPSAGPLFTSESIEGDEASGTIYVLRSKSDHPVVAANRDVVHKIGVTGGSLAKRIANARIEPTYLMADVEVVATYELYNINRSKLENLLHRVFEPARLDIQIKDRFGRPVAPREWFLVPLFAVNEVVEKIKDGTISRYVYDPKLAGLRQLA